MIDRPQSGDAAPQGGGDTSQAQSQSPAPAQPAAPAPQQASQTPAAQQQAPAPAPSQAKVDAQASAQSGQQAAAAKATEKCPQFFTQEKSNSCVVASSRNIIKEITGKDVPEDQLRGQMNGIINDPNHDWEKKGTNPSNAAKLLEANGVKAKVVPGAGVSNDDLAKMTEKKPVMIGFKNPGHRVVLDSVSVGPDGKKTYNVKDPARKFKGNVRQMSEDEFNAKRNPDAVVIVPE